MSESSPVPEQSKPDVRPPPMSEPSPITKDKTHLPPPIEIAKIAAILSHGGTLDRKAAIDEAIALALQAGVRYNELVELTFDEVLKEVGDLPLLDWLSERASPSRKLRLYPDKARVDPETKRLFFDGLLDQARSYIHLKAPYLNMKKTRSVLSTIKLYFLKTAHDHNVENKKKIEELEKRWAQAAKQRRKESGRTVTIDEVRNGWELTEHDRVRRDGEREYDDFVTQAAACSEGTSESHKFRPGKVRYWELSESFLDKLVVFRRKLKEEPGGIRALQNGLSKPSTKKNRNLSVKSHAKRRGVSRKRLRR